MEFIFETTYDKEALTVMAKALRKTVRKKKSQRSHVFGWIVVVLALLLSFSSGDEGFRVEFRTVVTWIAAAAMIAALIWEDRMNGSIARKRMLPGTEKATAVFSEDGYVTITEAGKTEWSYGKIGWIAETVDYFVFVFSMSHAQLYDKRNLSGGSEDEFRSFIESVTGKTVQKIK